MRPATVPSFIPALTALLVACDMQPAEILDYPRVLAIALEPADPVPLAEHTARALTFEVGAELEWAICPVFWSPTDLSCPTTPLVLGRGNPLTFTWPELERGWLKATPVDGSASPAAKLFEADAGAINPSATLVTSTGEALPARVAPSAELSLAVDLGELPEEVRQRVVVSWYVTAGTLEPARTRASETATWTAPAAPPPVPVRLIAVLRETKGGTSWTEATLTVGPSEAAP